MLLLHTANYISLIPLTLIQLSCIYYVFYLFDMLPTFFSLRFIVGIISSIYMSQYLKKIIFPFSKLARRPDKACNCNFYANNGIVEGQPGLPSTHMAIVGFLFMFSHLTITKYIDNTIFFYLVNTLFLLLTAWSRYYKKCHSLLQIILGGILGILYGYLVYHIPIPS